MNIVPRAILSTVVFAAAHFFSYWMVFLQIVPETTPQLAWSLSLATGCVAAALAWCKLGDRSQGFGATIACGAVTLGSFGLIAGFFGPVLLMPEVNQSPLLGLFVTGPLGFLAGGAIAALRWKWQHRRYG